MQTTNKNRISSLKLIFPSKDELGRNWFASLVQILSQAQGSTLRADELSIQPLQPQAALPLTAFALADEVVYPQLILETADSFTFPIGDFLISNFAHHTTTTNNTPTFETLYDENGSYIVLDEPTADFGSSAISLHRY